MEHDEAVGGVGCEQAQHAHDEKVEGGPAIPPVQRQPGGHAQEQHVHERVGHRDHLAPRRQVGVAGIGQDQEHPCHQTERSRDDEGIDQADRVPAGVALTDEDHHASDEQGIDEQVEHIPGGRKGRRRAMQQLWQRVVEGVAEDEHRDPCCEQVPGEPPPWPVQTDAHQDGHQRGDADHREGRALAAVGSDEQICERRQPSGPAHARAAELSINGLRASRTTASGCLGCPTCLPPEATMEKSQGPGQAP